MKKIPYGVVSGYDLQPDADAMSKQMKTTDSVIVAYDCTNGVDKSLMLVGKKHLSKKDVEIVKSFHGEEAEELWKKLTCKEGK